jgi:integrase
MRGRIYILTSFLHFVDVQGISSLASIRPALLTDFVSSLRHLKSGTVFGYVSALRSFFRYVFAHGLTPRDFSQDLPSVRVRRRDEQIPFVWTRSEVEALLGAVERDSPLGKRNYAILLLACRLGMRVGDIRELRLEHLLWDEGRIEFPQAKTGAVLTLPMSEEVGRALIDYLRHGRPTSPRREVFLRHRAPFEPFSLNANLHPIVTLYRRRAGIEATPGRSRGMHSLRHTLASHLLEADTPIETIADILGHRSVESTRVYTKVDLQALRSVALDPQEVADA